MPVSRLIRITSTRIDSAHFLRGSENTLEKKCWIFKNHFNFLNKTISFGWKMLIDNTF